jgi:hypothetical protein
VFATCAAAADTASIVTINAAMIPSTVPVHHTPPAIM